MRHFIRYIFACFVLCSLLISCNKDLQEVQPQDAIVTASAIEDPNVAQGLYLGVYTSLRGTAATLFQLGEMRSEIWADGVYTESPNSTYVPLYTQNISALRAPFANWGNLYYLLYQINNVIRIFPQTSLPVAQRNQELGEMYGLRAYVYYTLLRSWGTVPIVTEPLTAAGNLSSLYRPRSSMDSVLKLIKSDIEQSLTLFNGNNSFTAKRVYWNRVATLTLKGDVYIWSATLMSGGNTDLTTAMNALQEVENLQGSTLGLLSSYAAIFDPTKKTTNTENIVAISYELNQAQNTNFSDFRCNPTQAQTLLFDAGTPSQQLVSVAYPYMSAGDNRVGFTPALLTKLTSGPPDQRISGTFRVMYGTSAGNPPRGVMLTKWMGRANASAQLYDNDYPIYRYADVLLLQAEAKAKLGMDPSAEINQIRQRAYGNTYMPYVNSTVDDNMHAILEEQLREFIGEGKRWYALRRAGDQWVFNYINPSYLSPATVASGKGPTLLLPIPTTMLSGDPTLIQTPGY
ncbi:MAG: RagB/SusD family nutrient uptake outer membrane protein [Chitinophaga rupis]